MHVQSISTIRRFWSSDNSKQYSVTINYAMSKQEYLTLKLKLKEATKEVIKDA